MLSTALRSKGVRWIGSGWVAFIAENLVLSHNRESIIERLGDDNYHKIYNSLSTCACTSILYGYIRHGRAQGPKIWNPSRPLPMAAALILQSIGLIGFSQLVPKLQIPIAIRQPNTLLAGGNGEASSELYTVAKVQEPAGTPAVGSIQARCPMDFTPKDVPADGVYGVKRVTRHSTFWALGLLGAGTALGTPFASEIVMFGMPAVFAVIGGAHQDYRHRRGSGGVLPADVDAKTSAVPFVALILGRQAWSDVWNELKVLNAALAVLVALSLHRRRVALASLARNV